MGSDAVRIGLQIRRFLVISIRLCYRSVCNHPFLVGMVCFLIFLYRSFPFLFWLLVSASPVLVCTAVLLGSLLSFGEANIPEIEEEEIREEKTEVALEVSQLKAGAVEDATVVVNRDGSHSSLRFRGKRRDGAQKTIEEESLMENESGKMEEDYGLGDYVPLIDESSWAVHSEKQVVNDTGREMDDLRLENKQEIHEEKQGIKELLSDGKAAENQYCLVQNEENENLEEEDGTSPGSHLDFSQDPSWKRANDDDEEEEDEKASNSESDQAESSSPDASMADIIPMLDELHPLLDEEAPERPLISHQGSYAGSHKSKGSSVESEEDMENEADEEDADDNDNEEEEEEEEVQGGKEDESKSAIKWTEDDQKNLMDLGTSELERNQRLENLIARRRARRNMRLMAEKNLIDLDAADHPVNIPPISTTRQNPFDLPYDPYDDVPGSAPSILLPRRNPFDIPYESNEEKPDLKRDSFQQEFSAMQHKDPVFRRHESFSVGPSVLGGPRQDFRWKPYFVPERYATEGTSYHAFQRQSSEVSDSKLSSVPDTESVSSAVEDEDDSKANEDVCQETEGASSIGHASVLVERGSQSSHDIDVLGIEPVGKRDISQGEAEITLGEVENHCDIDTSLFASGGTTPVEQNTSEMLLHMEASEEEASSRSSLSSMADEDEKISDLNTGSATLEQRISQIEESYISTQTSLDSEFQFVSGKIDGNSCREPILGSQNDHFGEAVISTGNLISSDFKFTGAVDRVTDDNHNETPVLDSFAGHVDGSTTQHKGPVLEPESIPLKGSGISTQSSLNSDFRFPSGIVAGNHQHKEPVYDSSPPSGNEFLSFSSVSSGTLADSSDMGSPPTLAEFSEPELLAESMEKDGAGEIHEGSSQVHSSQENESGSGNITEDIEHDERNAGLPQGVVTNFDGPNGSVKPETVVGHASVDLPPSSSINGSSEEKRTCEKERSHQELDQSDSSIFDLKTIVGPSQDEIGELASASSSFQTASKNRNLPTVEEQDPLVVLKSIPAEPILSSQEAEYREERVASSPRHVHSDELNLAPCDERETSVVTGQVSDASHAELDSPRAGQVFDAKTVVGPCQEEIGELDSTSSSFHVAFENRTLPAVEEQHPPVVVKSVPPELILSSQEAEHIEERSLGAEDILQLRQESLSGAGILANGSQRAGEELDFVADSPKHVPSDVLNLSPHDERETSVVTGKVSDASHARLDQLDSSILDAKTIVGLRQDEIGERDSTSSSQMEVENRNLSTVEEQCPPVVVKSIPEEPVLSCQEAEHVEECAVGEEDILQPEQESCSGAGIQVNGSQVYDASLYISSSETKHLEELPLRSDETMPLEQDPVHSSNSVATNDTNGHQDMDVIVASSSYQHMHTDEKSPLELEKQLSWADKSVIEPSFNDHHELRESSGTLGGIPEVVSNTSNITTSNIHDHEDKLSRIITSLTSDSTSVPSESPEYKTPAAGLYLKDNILDKFVYEDGDHALERSNSLAEAYGSPIAESYEDYIEIKEIDEGLLLELDAVGDFSVKEVVGASLHDEQMPGENNSGGPDFDMLSNDSGLTEVKPEIPVLEGRSIEDIDSGFKQLHEQADIEEVILPSEIKDQFVVHELTGPGQTSSELQVVEAESLEDINIASNQVSRGNIDEPSRPSNSKDGAGEVKEAGSTKELPVLEVRTIEDIGLAFKQLQEGADVEDVIIPSAIEQPPIANELKDPGQTSSDLQVVEARSLEDIDIAMKHVSEGNPELSRLSHLKERPAKEDELGSTNELPILEVRTIEDIDLAFKQLQEGADVEEVILPSSVEQQQVLDESNNNGRTSSHMQVVEAKSLEDIHVAMKQVSGSNTENIPEETVCKTVGEGSASVDNKSRSLEVNEDFTKGVEPHSMEEIEMGSTKESRASNVEPSVHETSSTDAFLTSENHHEHVGGEGNKEKYSRSNSSSSSSSNSSDSD